MADTAAETLRPPVRVGILGAGRAFFSVHLVELTRLKEFFSVVAVCDYVKERRDMAERHFPDARLYRQAKDLYEDPDVEVILVSSPSTLHEQHCRESLAAGKWTVCEAPMALTCDGANFIKAAAIKARGRFVPYLPGLFEREFLLAKKALAGGLVGTLHTIRLRRSDWVRMDDWQTVIRCGGGVAWHTAPDMLAQAGAILQSPPQSLWSDTKRVAALGDAEDRLKMLVRTREGTVADIEIDNGLLPPYPPRIELLGDRGRFSVDSGAAEGLVRAIDPSYAFPRRRSSVRTPAFEDRHEKFPVIERRVALDAGAICGPEAFWRAFYASVRVAAPSPVSMDDAVEAIRCLQLVKRIV